MKLTSYKKALEMGKKAVDKMLIPSKCRRTKKQAELEICKIEEEIATLENDIREECYKDEVNFNRIIELQDRLGLKTRRQKQFQQILDEMFPEEE